MKQREGYKVIISDEAQRRIAEDKCPSCGKEKKYWKRRKDWRCCSTYCTDAFEKKMIIYGWQHLRIKALKRDNFTCVKCGKKPTRSNGSIITGELVGDHIKPIAIGGDEWDINNVQTLCITCNKIKTRQDMKDIAKARRVEKHLRKGQRTLWQ